MDGATATGGEAAQGGSNGIPEIVFEGDAGSDAIPVIDPSTIPESASIGDAKQKRGRGRPRGSNSTSSAKNSAPKKERQDDLTGILVGIHAILSTVTGIEELAIDKDEAAQLNAALGRVNEYYGGLEFAEETIVWTKLVIALGSVYGIRMSAYFIRKNAEAAAAKAGQPQTINVTPTRVN